jgi:hypothetical protein
MQQGEEDERAEDRERGQQVQVGDPSGLARRPLEM